MGRPLGLLAFGALPITATVIRRVRLLGADRETLYRLGWYCGLFAPTVALGGIAGAMVATGLLALPFGVALLVEGNRAEQLSVGCLAVAMQGLNMVVLFQRGQRLHLLGGQLFFVCFTAALLLLFGRDGERPPCTSHTDACGGARRRLEWVQVRDGRESARRVRLFRARLARTAVDGRCGPRRLDGMVARKRFGREQE